MEEKKKGLYVRPRKLDGKAAMLVDEQKPAAVEGCHFPVDPEAAGAGKHGNDAGPGDMFWTGIGFRRPLGQKEMIGKTEGFSCG